MPSFPFYFFFANFVTAITSLLYLDISVVASLRLVWLSHRLRLLIYMI